MNLVLLYNGASATFADTDDIPSFSLMTVSAYLKANGFRCELLLNRHTDEDLRRLLGECVAAGFSVYTGTGLMRSLRMSQRLKRLRPDLPIVWGGCHPTLESDQTVRNDAIDFVVRGEGEQTMLELARALQDNAPDRFPGILGLSFKQGGAVAHNPPRPAADINQYPTPDYDLYDQALRGRDLIPYIASRGCPFDCKFCCSAAMNRLHGKKFMALDIHRAVSDLDVIVARYHPRIVDFIDDNFLLSEKRVAAFIEQYRQKKYTFEWIALGRCDVFAKMDEQIIAGLKSIRLKKIFFGVESGAPHMLDYIGKRETRDQTLRAVEKVARHGIAMDCTFMNGFPTETWEDVRCSLDLRRHIKKLSPASTVRFFVFTPLPATDLYKECTEKYGLKKPERMEEWIDFEFHTFRPVWLPYRYRNRINAIAWASFFDNYVPPDNTRSLVKRLFGWMGALSRFRLDHDGFGWAPELLLVNVIFTLKSRSYVRQIMREKTGGA